MQGKYADALGDAAVALLLRPTDETCLDRYFQALMSLTAGTNFSEWAKSLTNSFGLGDLQPYTTPSEPVNELISGLCSEGGSADKAVQGNRFVIASLIMAAQWQSWKRKESEPDSDECTGLVAPSPESILKAALEQRLSHHAAAERSCTDDLFLSNGIGGIQMAALFCNLTEACMQM
eukprot:GHVU01076414.1.p2 GENE.GHVU01076414.1~~GHVU01076414.1.p2  ORF type:complete len:177 (-),score=20.69 GHVU01076414.1:998-1528(-)